MPPSTETRERVESEEAAIQIDAEPSIAVDEESASGSECSNRKKRIRADKKKTYPAARNRRIKLVLDIRSTTVVCLNGS